ncbi:MAG TPA: PsbP-related protein [Acidimicrobiia bacterium]
MRHMPIPIVAAAALTAALGAACGGDGADGATTNTTAPPAPATTVNVETFERFTSPELGFSISYPAQWTVAPSLGEGFVQFSAPLNTGGFTPNFNVTTGQVPDDVPFTVYYDGERAKLESNLPDVRILEEANIVVDGVPGRGITLVTGQDGIDVGISRFIVTTGGQAWEVSFFAEARQLEELAPLVTEIFQSFAFAR